MVRKGKGVLKGGRERGRGGIQSLSQLEPVNLFDSCPAVPSPRSPLSIGVTFLVVIMRHSSFSCLQCQSRETDASSEPLPLPRALHTNHPGGSAEAEAEAAQGTLRWPLKGAAQLSSAHHSRENVSPCAISAIEWSNNQCDLLTAVVDKKKEKKV